MMNAVNILLSYFLEDNYLIKMPKGKLVRYIRYYLDILLNLQI